MRLSLLSLLSLSTSIHASALPQTRPEPSVISGKYIVQLKNGISPAAISAHHRTVRRLARRDSPSEIIERTFSIGDFNAYVGTLDPSALAEIEALDDVLSVTPDEIIYLPITTSPSDEKRALTSQQSSPWNLADLSHKNGSTNTKEYVYHASAGAGTTAYVFDSGIRRTHNDFEGRVRFGINGVTNSTTPVTIDPKKAGHGTHVAGTIGGKTFGVAKKVQLVDVVVTDGDTGSLSALLTGIDWAVKDVVARKIQRTSVFSMSLGATTTDNIIANAVIAAFNQGILSVVSAGNDDSPVSDSPARVPEVFTVGMTQPDRRRVSIIEGIYGSSYGPEVDIFAPGRDIVSADSNSDTGNATRTGTSMSAPLVSGLVCYLRALTGGLGTPKEVTARILELALKDVVGDPKNSVNLLAYNGNGA